MCLLISALLMLFGINMLMAGDYFMGIASSVTALFFITLMIRRFIYVKKENGRLNVKDCLSCNTTIPEIKDEA